MTLSLKDGADLARLPVKVVARLDVAAASAERAASAVNARMTAARLAELNADVRRIGSGKLKRREIIKTLWRMADVMGRVAYPESACKAGCSHCCHTPVALTQQEAHLIGELIGREPLKPQLGPVLRPKVASYNNPCVFLKEGRCSIYEARPLSCRLLFNMDTDPLLCELVEDASVPVPFLNLTQLQLLYVQACPGGLAELGEFFPVEENSAQHS